MYATLYLLEINKHSYLMTCHAYMLTGVGLDLMHLLGWVSIHDTHHHMGFLRKKFCSWYFWCMDFWVVTLLVTRMGNGEGLGDPGVKSTLLKLAHPSHDTCGTSCERAGLHRLTLVAR